MTTTTPLPITSPRREGEGLKTALVIIGAIASIALAVSLLPRGPASVGDRSFMIFDGPTFESVEGLAETSEAVVQGEVLGVHSRQIDYGGEEPAEEEKGDRDGLPVVVYEVAVGQVPVGKVGGDTVLVAMLDEERVASEHVTPLAKGAEVVLFLDRLDAEQAPGLKVEGDLYVPLNYNNGVLTVEDRRAAGSGDWLRAATKAEAEKILEAEAGQQVEEGHEKPRFGAGTYSIAVKDLNEILNRFG